MANPEQMIVLKRGVEAWNTWREAHPDQEPDFRWANFSLANLRGVDLSHARLDRANLSGAMLSQANLHAASLRETSLGEANLSGARLDAATLKRVDLSRANLSRASFQGADLSHANLSRADLFEANFKQAIFSEALLYQTSFGNTRLAGASGLETCRHLGPSLIDRPTLAHHPYLPEPFLQGCGLQAWEIEAVKLYDPALTPPKITEIVQRIHRLRAEHPLQRHNLFLSYSHADAAFVEHLETHLKARHILFWRDIHDAPAPRPDNIVIRAMRQNPTVLLILSQHTAARNWVDYEIDQAHTLAHTLGRTVLCLISLDETRQADSGPEAPAEPETQPPVLDFSNWNDAPGFEDAFARLIECLALFSE